MPAALPCSRPGVSSEEAFPAEEIEVNAHGNVLAATAFPQVLAAEELEEAELDDCDREYECSSPSAR